MYTLPEELLQAHASMRGAKRKLVSDHQRSKVCAMKNQITRGTH